MNNNILSMEKYCRKCRSNCCSWGKPLISKEERELILLGGYEDVFIKEKDYFRIAVSDDGGCYFLKRGKCRIQKVKPIGCQIFPITKYYDAILDKVKIGICDKCYASNKLTKTFRRNALRLIEFISDDQARLWTDQDNFPVIDLILP
jgi:Fe-S-cluster containining protein